MVSFIEQDYILLFWGIVFYIRNVVLLGSTTKKRYSHESYYFGFRAQAIGDFLGLLAGSIPPLPATTLNSKFQYLCDASTFCRASRLSLQDSRMFRASGWKRRCNTVFNLWINKFTMLFLCDSYVGSCCVPKSGHASGLPWFVVLSCEWTQAGVCFVCLDPVTCLSYYCFAFCEGPTWRPNLCLAT